MAEERGVVTQRTARQTRHSDRHGLAWRRHIRQRRQGTREPAPASRPSHSSDSSYARTSPYRTSSRHWDLWVASGQTPTGVSDVTMSTSVNEVTAVRIPAEAVIFLFALKSSLSRPPRLVASGFRGNDRSVKCVQNRTVILVSTLNGIRWRHG
jgi:hypothetical protein